MIQRPSLNQASTPVVGVELCVKIEPNYILGSARFGVLSTYNVAERLIEF